MEGASLKYLYLFVAAALLFAGCCQAVEKSIVVDGWEFTADLGEEWRYDPGYSDDRYDDGTDCRTGALWEVHAIGKPFFIPKNDEEVHYSGVFNGKSGFVDIEVLKIPSEFDGVDMKDILTLAADRFHCPTVGLGSDKDITFDGKEAHLWEEDDDVDDRYVSEGVIAVKLNDEKIAVIQVERWDDTGKRAWDVIEAFTITQSQ